MKINYLGPFTGVEVFNGMRRVAVLRRDLGGESVEVADAIAEEMVRRDPESWEIAKSGAVAEAAEEK